MGRQYQRQRQRLHRCRKRLPRRTRCPENQAAELRALLGLRDAGWKFLIAEADGRDDRDIDSLRDELKDAYSQYVDTYGPINRFILRHAGRDAIDEET